MAIASELSSLERRVTAIERHLGLAAVPAAPPPALRRMVVGVNVDAQSTQIEDVISSNAKFARFPVWADALPTPEASLRIYSEYAARLASQHIEPLIVCDSRSWANDNYPLWATMPVHYVQMGNEWDILSESSFTQTAAQFSADLRWAREWFDTHRPDGTPRRYLIAGGAASGHEWLLHDVDLSPVDAIAVHPYGQRADGYPRSDYGHGELRDLIRRYKQFHKPIWITENGWRDDEVDQETQAELLSRTMEIAEEEGVVAYLPYTLVLASSDQFDLDPGIVLETFRREARLRSQ